MTFILPPSAFILPWTPSLTAGLPPHITNAPRMIYHRRVKAPAQRGVQTRRAIACLLQAIVVVCVLNSTARARSTQEQTRGFNGVVVDQNQAPVAGATVTLRETSSTSGERHTTNAQGEFEFDRP